MATRTLNGKPSTPRLAGRRLLQTFGVHPRDTDAVPLDMKGTRALCIGTNHGVLDIGVATGVFASELTVPYYCFLDAGMQVDVASPLGGIIPVDPLSMKPEIRTPEWGKRRADFGRARTPPAWLRQAARPAWGALLIQRCTTTDPLNLPDPRLVSSVRHKPRSVASHRSATA